MELENSRKVQFEILSSSQRSGHKKDGSQWYGKALLGKVLPESHLKTSLKVNTMIFGEGNNYPEGFEVGDVVNFYISGLEFKTRTIQISGEVIL